MLAIASQIILCLVLAALLGLIIGYLLGKSNCPKETYRAGVVHDPHTEDDGDCDDKDDESDEVSGGVEADDHAATTEAQGVLETSDNAEASEELENTAEAQGLLSASDAPEASAETAEEPVAAEAAAEAQTAATATDVSSEAHEARDEKSESEKAEEIPSDEDKPATLLDAPRNGKKDNLTRIKGIGVKIDTLLNSIGVYHFDQIAAWTDKEAAWIDHQVSFPGRSIRDDWVGQAKLLAEGKETEFSKRVDKGEVSTSKKG